MIRLGTACRRYRPTLFAFVDRRELGPTTDAALDHLQRCRSCAHELETTALTIAALRRMARDPAAAEPTPDAWQRLRARIDRPRATLWRWRAALGGLALSGALVALTIGPSALWTSRQVYLQETGLGAISETRLAEERVESRIIDQQRTVRSVPPSAAPPAAVVPAPTAAEAGWRGPDGVGVAMPAATVLPPVHRIR